MFYIPSLAFRARVQSGRVQYNSPRTGSGDDGVGQIANRPCPWQVGNLPHIAIVMEPAIICGISSALASSDKWV